MTIKLTTPPPEHPHPASPAPAPAAAPAPTGPTTSGKQSHDAAVIAAEGQRQTAVASAGSQAAVRSAEIAYYRTFVTSALQNGISPSSAIRALQNLGVTGL
jgi:hypothetical protein